MVQKSLDRTESPAPQGDGGSYRLPRDGFYAGGPNTALGLQDVSMARFHKHDVARLQLLTAVDIFLRGLDRSSVITLAGAASGILDTLVKRACKEPFVDYARRVHSELVGYTPKRKSYSYHINIKLGVIAHRHLAKDDPDTVELDLEKQAVDVLGRAISDYISLNGEDEPFVKAFLSWAWKNTDGPTLMEKFKTVPDRMKPK